MIGGPAPERLQRDLIDIKKRFADDRDFFEKLKMSLKKSSDYMESEIDKILNAK